MYFVFFLVTAAGAYAVLATAEAPTVDVQGQTLSQNDTFRVNGEQFTVSELKATTTEEHGNKVTKFQGTLEFTNESFKHTTKLKNGSNVSFRNGTYRVLIPNGSNVSRFTVRQQFNVSQRLRQDPRVENQTLQGNGTTYVRFKNGTTQPLDEYLPEPNTANFSVGDTFPFKGNRTNVTEVTPEAVTLVFTAPKQQSAELTEGGNVTLAGEEYFAHFEGTKQNPRVVLAPTKAQYANYNNQLQQQSYFHERMNGLWGVIILSALAAIIVTALAYMPVKG